MKTLFLILLLTLTAYSQEPPKTPDEVKPEQSKCRHTDDEDFYSSLRHSGPVQMLMIDGRSITTVRMTKHLIKHETFSMDSSNVRVAKDAYQISKEKRWFILYCFVHMQAFVIERADRK